MADNPEALKEYLLNIYLTLMTRGIKGTYIYVCDDALRKYFEKYIDVIEWYVSLLKVYLKRDYEKKDCFYWYGSWHRW